MSNLSSLRFSLSVLQQEGAYLLHAAHQPEMDARLSVAFLPATTTAHQALFGPPPLADGEDPPDSPPAAAVSKTPKSKVAPVLAPAESALACQANASTQAGNLTLEQNEALDELTTLMAGARDNARRTFKDQSVKLHEGYQIGEHDSRTLADITTRAGIILASCRRAAAALKDAGGWAEGGNQCPGTRPSHHQRRRHRRQTHPGQHLLQNPTPPPKRRPPAMARPPTRQRRPPPRVPPRPLPAPSAEAATATNAACLRPQPAHQRLMQIALSLRVVSIAPPKGWTVQGARCILLVTVRKAARRSVRPNGVLDLNGDLFSIQRGCPFLC